MVPYDVCKIHLTQMTGFTTLFCPVCEKEKGQSTKKNQRAEKNQRTDLSSYKDGNYVHFFGAFVEVNLELNSAANEIIYGDIESNKGLIRFRVEDPRLINRYKGAPLMKYYWFYGKVRHHIWYLDGKMTDILLTR